MAILNQGILGGGRNAVGTVVMSRWKGKDVIRTSGTKQRKRASA